MTIKLQFVVSCCLYQFARILAQDASGFLLGMENKMKKMVLASALVLSISSVQAVESPRWDYATLSYQTVDIDGEKLSGLGFGGSKLLGKNVFVSGAYSNTSDTINSVDFDFNTLSVGLGYRTEISSKTDFFGVVSYEDVELESSFRGNSDKEGDSGYGLTAGVRSMLTDKVELTGSLKYIDIAEETDTGLSVSALYNFTTQFSAGVGYTKSDDIDGFSISAVYFF